MRKIILSIGVVALVTGIGLAIQPSAAEAEPPFLCTNHQDTEILIGNGATCVEATQDLRVKLWAEVNTLCNQYPFSGSCGSGLVINVPCDYDENMQVQVSGHMSYRCRFYP